MKASCELKIDFVTKDKVNTVLRAIKVDDFDFVKYNTDGTILTAHLQSNSVSSLLHTIDDYLACVNVAAKVADKD